MIGLDRKTQKIVANPLATFRGSSENDVLVKRVELDK